MKGDFLSRIPLPSFFPLLLRAEMIAENRKNEGNHYDSGKTMSFWDTNYFPPASVLSLVLMISLFDTHSCFLIRSSQDVSCAPYAAEMMWTHYFSFDIISIQTCQPVQIGLQTVPSRTLDASSVTNERPGLWRIDQWEARTGEDEPCDHNIPCAIRLPPLVSHPTTINTKIDLWAPRIKELNMKTLECFPFILSPSQTQTKDISNKNHSGWYKTICSALFPCVGSVWP